MSTTRNAAYVLSAQAALLLSGTIISVGLGRMLGPELYGKYGVVLAVATVLNVLLTPGLMQAVAKHSAEKKEKAAGIASAVLRKQFIIGIAMAAAYFLLAIPLTGLLKDKTLLHMLWILAPMIIIYGTTAILSGFLTGTGRFLEQSIQLVIYATSRLFLTFILAYLFSITGAVAALPLASLLALIYAYKAARIGKSEENNHTKEIYSLSIRLAIFSAIIATFMNVDILMVKALLGNDALTGYYTAASTIARMPYFLLTALGTLMLPSVAEKLAMQGQQAQKFIRESIRYVLILLIPGTVIVAATAKPLVMLLYKSDYAQAAQPAATLAIGTAALTIAYLLSTALNASGKTRTTVTVAFIMLIASVAANLYAIPQQGIKGAAATVSAASIMAAAFLLVAAYKKFGNFISYKSLARITIASAITFAAIKIMPLENKFLLPIEYAALGIIYTATLFALREINSSDIEKVKNIIPKKMAKA